MTVPDRLRALADRLEQEQAASEIARTIANDHLTYMLDDMEGLIDTLYGKVGREVVWVRR